MNQRVLTFHGGGMGDDGMPKQFASYLAVSVTPSDTNPSLHWVVVTALTDGCKAVAPFPHRGPLAPAALDAAAARLQELHPGLDLLPANDN